MGAFQPFPRNFSSRLDIQDKVLALFAHECTRRHTFILCHNASFWRIAPNGRVQPLCGAKVVMPPFVFQHAPNEREIAFVAHGSTQIPAFP
jgi:hypothetical protein